MGASLKIGVIGAGVVGVSAALALARRGHHVTVFDRETAPEFPGQVSPLK